MDWKQLLVYITGSVEQELLLRNEYLVTENRLLRKQIQGRVRLTDAERPHQGRGDVILMPLHHHCPERDAPSRCRERLGGLLKYYDHEAT